VTRKSGTVHALIVQVSTMRLGRADFEGHLPPAKTLDEVLAEGIALTSDIATSEIGGTLPARAPCA
jgi:hypothetical protein